MRVKSFFHPPITSRRPALTPFWQAPLVIALAAFLAAATLTSSRAHAQQTLTVTNNAPGTFDGNSGARTFDFSAYSGLAGLTIADVGISLTFEKPAFDAFSNPFFNEITFTLSSPGGGSVFLINQGSFDIGNTGASFNGTIVFSDAAAQLVNVDPNLLTPGTFRSVEPLSLFNGQIFNAGIWTLGIEDIQAGDPLNFSSAALSIAVVPEPTTNALLALGGLLLGAVVLRRHRRGHAVAVMTTV